MFKPRATRTVAFYGVRTLSAVLKSANHRSMRLLERLGFELISANEHATFGVEPDERLMLLKRLADAQAP